MRLLVPLAVMFALASAAPAADDAAEAKAIVEKAIKARGDKPGDKHTAMTWKEKGTLGMGKVLELLYTADCAFQAPDKFRQTTTISFGDAKGHGTTVINGENAWQDEAEEVKKLTGGGLARAQNGVYQFWVTSLTSLVTEKGFTLAIAKGKDVDKKPTVGVTVIRDSAYGVPHIYGDTRADTMFGAGYAGAEDRLFLMDILRHTGRATLSSFVGVDLPGGNPEVGEDPVEGASLELGNAIYLAEIPPQSEKAA